jgi:hypothetical protein
VPSAARAEILRSTGGNPPPVYDPFAGGGSIPLEAHASGLNPVAVLINKALIEIPPKFTNMPPVNPEDRNRIGAEWKGAGPGRRCALLWQVDARRGQESHRPPLLKGGAAEGVRCSNVYYKGHPCNHHRTTTNQQHCWPRVSTR